MTISRIASAAFLSLLLGLAVTAGAQDRQEKRDHPAQQQNGPEQAKPAQQHAQPQRQPQQHAQQQQRQDQNKQEQQHAQQQQRQAQSNRQQQAQQQQRQDQNNRQQHAQQQRQDQNNRQHAQQQQRQDQNNRQERAQQQRGNDRVQRSPERQRVEQSSWQEHRSRNWDSDHRNWQQRGGYHGYRVPDDRYRGYFGPNHGFRIGGLPFLVVGGYPRFQYEGYWISTVDPWPEYWGDNWYDNDDVYVAYVDNGYYMYNRRYPGSGVAISISF